MEITLLNAIELVAGFQAFLFAVYLVLKKDGQKISNYFIAIFIALLAYNILDYFASFILNSFSENIKAFLQMFIYLAAPALFLHIKFFLFPDTRLRAKNLVHTIVYLATLMGVVALILSENEDGVIPEETEFKYSLMYYAVLYIQMYTYLFLSYRLLKKHKEIFFENYSNTNTKRYTYLKRLIFLVAGLFLLSFVNILTRFALQLENFRFISYVVISAVLFLFCWLIFNGLKSPELFVDKKNVQPPVKDLVKEKSKISKLETDEESREMLENVNRIMVEKEPFLDASLSLHTLASETEIPARELSILINHHLNKHFFDFVNEFRIEKAKELLTSPDKKEFTVLEILYEVGFNSKSSFNTAFKKHTGLTPTNYRKKHSLSAA